MEGVKKMIELVRCCFIVLYRDNIINNHYIILNDNYFYSDNIITLLYIKTALYRIIDDIFIF